MPTRPIQYVDQPFVGNVGSLAQMLQRGGDLQAQQALAAGQSRAATWGDLARAFTAYQMGVREKQVQQAALAQRERERQEANALKLLEIDERKAERAEQNRIRLEAEGRQKREDALKRARGIADRVVRGPLMEEQVELLMESPETMGRVRYAFGPGTSEGPELTPTSEQLRQDALDQALIDQRNKPPAPKSLQRETALVNGKRSFVNFNPEDGSYTDLQGNKVTPDPIPPQASSTGPRPLTQTAEAQIINRLSNQWITANKPLKDLERQVELMKTGMDAVNRGDLAQGAQMVLVTFQKILDPPSVVREAEFMRSAAGQSLMNRVRGAYERLTKGGAGVTAPELQKFAALADEAAQAQRRASGIDGVRSRLGRTAQRYNIPEELIFEAPEAATPEVVEEWDFDANGNLVKKGGG